MVEVTAQGPEASAAPAEGISVQAPEQASAAPAGYGSAQPSAQQMTATFGTLATSGPSYYSPQAAAPTDEGLETLPQVPPSYATVPLAASALASGGLRALSPALSSEALPLLRRAANIARATAGAAHRSAGSLPRRHRDPIGREVCNGRATRNDGAALDFERPSQRPPQRRAGRTRPWGR